MSVKERVKFLEEQSTATVASHGDVNRPSPSRRYESNIRHQSVSNLPLVTVDEPDSRPALPTRRTTTNAQLSSRNRAFPSPSRIGISSVGGASANDDGSSPSLFPRPRSISSTQTGGRLKTDGPVPPSKPAKSPELRQKANALLGNRQLASNTSTPEEITPIDVPRAKADKMFKPMVMIDGESGEIIDEMKSDIEELEGEREDDSPEMVYLDADKLSQFLMEDPQKLPDSNPSLPERPAGFNRGISDTFLEVKKGFVKVGQAAKPALVGVEHGFKKIGETAKPAIDGVEQGFIKVGRAAKPAIDELGQGFVKAGQAAKPTTDGVGQGFKSVGNGFKNLAGKAEVPKVFLQTSEDFQDAAAKLQGVQGLCSKCKAIPVERFLVGKVQKDTGNDLEWASPLSRMIYHADWCRVCRFLLDMICEPQNDPLKHSAIADFVQPKLAGFNMREWVDRGWHWTDQNWPFGHSRKRHEGASYVLGPTGEILWSVAQRLGTFGAYFLYRNKINPRRCFADVSKGYNKLARSYDARNPQQYPLSCVIKISANTELSVKYPGMILVNVFGYGRGPAAKVQVLSEFRLRAQSIDEETTAGLDLAQSSQPFAYWKSLGPHWIDSSVIRLWLRECEEKHGIDCQDHGWNIILQDLSFLRVIDVQDLCIREIAHPAECRFIALSYVWGVWPKMVRLKKSNMAALSKKKGLAQFLSKLPQTIIDAMEVVSALGERYLWTDALGIVQDDPEEMARENKNMDKVYDSSLATIIGAQGTTADSGLEGDHHHYLPDRGQRLGSQRYLYQTSSHLKDNTLLVAPLKTNNHEVETSAWNSKAWTFQERLLSRRLIIFTHGQVVWQCRQIVCREDMPIEVSGIPCSRMRFLQLTRELAGGKNNYGDISF